MFSTGNKGPCVGITRLIKISSFITLFSNCNFNEFFSFVKFIKIAASENLQFYSSHVIGQLFF